MNKPDRPRTLINIRASEAERERWHEIARGRKTTISAMIRAYFRRVEKRGAKQ